MNTTTEQITIQGNDLLWEINERSANLARFLLSLPQFEEAADCAGRGDAGTFLCMMRHEDFFGRWRDFKSQFAFEIVPDSEHGAGGDYCALLKFEDGSLLDLNNAQSEAWALAEDFFTERQP
jgi:hypothetical protein